MAQQRQTLFDMAGSMLIESELPKGLSTDAVQTAAIVRNRFTKQTPYFMLMGKQLCVMPTNKIIKSSVTDQIPKGDFFWIRQE